MNVCPTCQRTHADDIAFCPHDGTRLQQTNNALTADEPEPLAEVKRIAERVPADQPAEYDTLKQNSRHAVPRAGEITFVPVMAGCEFKPPRRSFLWQKSVHKLEFEMLTIHLPGHIVTTFRTSSPLRKAFQRPDARILEPHVKFSRRNKSSND